MGCVLTNATKEKHKLFLTMIEEVDGGEGENKVKAGGR